MDLGIWLLAFGTTARITRFINEDVLAQPLRDTIERRFGYASKMDYLATCPWCLTIWTAPLVYTTALWWGHTDWWLIATGSLTASYTYGIVSANLDPAYTTDDE